MRQFLIAATCLAAGLMSLQPIEASADPGTSAAPTSASAVVDGGVEPSARPSVLGPNWQSSSDRLWTLVPTSDGLSVLSADVSRGATWRTVTRLTVAGVESRQWIGQACLLANSSKLAVAFGPIEYISTSSLFERGAFAALVDLDSDTVTSLPLRPTFSYFSPTCGADGHAAFTSFAADESATSVSVIDASAQITHPVTLAPGEWIDGTGVAGGAVVAASGSRLVKLQGGQEHPLLNAPNTISQLHVTPRGYVYVADRAGTSEAHAVTNGRDTVVAAAHPGDLAVDSLASGRVSLHGASLHVVQQATDAVAASAPVTASASTAGTVYSLVTGSPDAPSGATVTVIGQSGKQSTHALSKSVVESPSDAAGVPQPSAMANATTTTAATTDANLPCAVKRNDPKTEAYQPSTPQVEWAVDQAVRGLLKPSRAAGYRSFGLPAYSAQGLFPLHALSGGGSVPPQVVLGILANESNLWQASSHVSPGGYGNPLTGNVYGRSFDSNGNESMTIDFSQADCGYGIAQVTDGMRVGDQSGTTQRAIALDYQVNIAAGLNILIDKWNQLASYTPRISMNNGDSSAIENWYAAIWAYNTGLQPNSANGNSTGCTPGPSCTDGQGYWGLGWANNPANPIYPPNRWMFNSQGTDAAHPSQWPYQERVIGWAAYPIYEPSGSYSQAWWINDAFRQSAIPSSNLFCTAANNCTPGATPNAAGSCNLSNFHCWTHFPVSWKDCAANQCGYANMAYSSSAGQPADPKTQDPADCNRSSLPASAVIVDDIPSGSPAAGAPCHSVGTSGSFTFKFTSDANGNYPAHIDLHQINGGLNGHYWFTHSVQASGNTLNFTGTWKFPSTTTGWGTVMVHVPALGAQALQAKYTIYDGATGASQQRTLDQAWGSNHWLSLGAVKFTANERVQLTSYAPHDGSSADVAWDAVAFVPRSRPVYKVVAMGDSYSAGEGLQPFLANADNPSDACHRSPQAYANLLTLPGQTSPLGQNSADELDFIACSGAHTTSIAAGAVNSSSTQENPWHSYWGAPVYEHGEELQVSQGYADARTDAVVLSIGGNDARFSDIVSFCSKGLTTTDCSANGQVMGSDPAALNTYEPHVIQDLLPAKLQAVYAAVHAAAPNAVIFVVGYPRLFAPNAQPLDCPANITISANDMAWLNSMADMLDGSIKTTISTLQGQGVKIHYVDPQPTFTGHDICSSSPWINGVIAYSDSGSGHQVPGAGSYHPNAAGQAAFAQAVSSAMTAYLAVKTH